MLNVLIISLACGPKHTFTEFADNVKWGKKWSVKGRALSREAVESSPLEIFKPQSDKFHSHLMEIPS